MVIGAVLFIAGLVYMAFQTKLAAPAIAFSELLIGIGVIMGGTGVTEKAMRTKAANKNTSNLPIVLLLLGGASVLFLFTGCASPLSNPNALTSKVTQEYGAVTITAETTIPHDVAANGMSIRVHDFQDSIGERAEFNDPVTNTVDAPRNSGRFTSKGVSDEAELAIFDGEHLGYEFVIDRPVLVNQEAIAIANNNLQQALQDGNTEQIQAWGSILASITQAAIEAAGNSVIPLP